MQYLLRPMLLQTEEMDYKARNSLSALNNKPTKPTTGKFSMTVLKSYSYVVKQRQ